MRAATARVGASSMVQAQADQAKFAHRCPVTGPADNGQRTRQSNLRQQAIAVLNPVQSGQNEARLPKLEQEHRQGALKAGSPARTATARPRTIKAHMHRPPPPPPQKGPPPPKKKVPARGKAADSTRNPDQAANRGRRSSLARVFLGRSIVQGHRPYIQTPQGHRASHSAGPPAGLNRSARWPQRLIRRRRQSAAAAAARRWGDGAPPGGGKRSPRVLVARACGGMKAQQQQMGRTPGRPDPSRPENRPPPAGPQRIRGRASNGNGLALERLVAIGSRIPHPLPCHVCCVGFRPLT